MGRSAFNGGALRCVGEISVGAHGLTQTIPCLEDRLPSGAATEVGLKRPLDRSVVGSVSRLLSQRSQPNHNAWRAKSALTSTGGTQCLGPLLTHLGLEPVDGGDHASCHPPSGRDTGDARRAVDQDGAAAALALRAATIFGTPAAHTVAEYLEQAGSVVVDLDRFVVDDEGERGQLKEEPQPQVRWAFGLSIEKPVSLRPSL